MADEYIRLDTTIIAIDRLINEAATGTMARTLFKAKDTLYSQQRYVIDVQPVKRGFWKALMMSEETGWDLSLTGGHDTVCEYVCSVCGKPNIVDEFGDSYLPNFCPNCGARMIKDGDVE